MLEVKNVLVTILRIITFLCIIIVIIKTITTTKTTRRRIRTGTVIVITIMIGLSVIGWWLLVHPPFL